MSIILTIVINIILDVVEVVKIEENDPVILPEMSPEETPTAAADSTPQISFDTINAQQNTTPELLMTSEIKTAPPNPGIIFNGVIAILLGECF